MTIELSELGDSIHYLKEAAIDASGKAEDLSKYCEHQWTQLNELARRLVLISRWIDVVVPNEIDDAIEGAYEERNRIEDLADAQSY